MPKQTKKQKYTPQQYEKKKNAALIRSRQEVAKGREIGPLPSVVDPKRRAKASESLRYFCEAYFPHIFSLAWSRDHLTAIERIETAILTGGKFALAMPRGQGKTSLLTAAMLWGLVTGKIKHGVIVSATAEAATQLLDDIKTELEGNDEGPDHIGADFPEVCFPIRQLDAIHARCRGQLLDGKRTKIQFVKNGIILPTVDGSLLSGSIIVTRGLLAGIRGLKKKNNRPDCVLLDDPQTDLSARSPAQTTTRLKIIGRGIKGLAGPGKKLAILAAVTVIEPADLASALLDRKRFPSWHGERFAMLESFPTNMERWQEYADVRREALIDTNSDEAAAKAAAEFYTQHRTEMDAGAVAAWPERFEPGEVSAIQNAMNLYLDDKSAFFAEYQNQPFTETENTNEITDETIRSKTIATAPRLIVPLECQHVTAAVDVHKGCLFYMVAAWTDKFSGHILDYGTFPDQRTAYPFPIADCRYTLEEAFPSQGLEGAIYSGLENLVGRLATNRYTRTDGIELAVKQMLIDARWGEMTPTVTKFCRESKHAAIVLPSYGQYYGPADSFFSGKAKGAERRGIRWKVPAVRVGESRHVIFDSNFWKSFLAARLLAGIGDKATLTLFNETHDIVADHFTAEYATPITSRGRSMDIWKMRPGRHENHLFDVAVLNLVAASIQGVALESHEVAKPKQKSEPIRFSEIQKAKGR